MVQTVRFLMPIRVFRKTVRHFSLKLTMSQNSASNLSAFSKGEVKEFLDSVDTVLTDCDGVIWMENEEIPGASQVLNKLRGLGKRVFFITNNSTKVREDFVLKANKMGFIAEENDILSTAFLTASYFKDLDFKKKVYVIGSPGLAKELDNFGIRNFGIGPDVMTHISSLVNKEAVLDPEVGAVVVGFDEHFSYPKLLKAASYLNDPECIFIATNTDERFPMDTGLVVPGTGSLVRSVETCAERKAFVIGKPDKYVSEAISKNFGVDPKRTLMIGDRCNTDILLGTRCGFKTLLVLTGVTTLDEVKRWQHEGTDEEKEFIPDVYLQGIGDLLPFLNFE